MEGIATRGAFELNLQWVEKYGVSSNLAFNVDFFKVLNSEVLDNARATQVAATINRDVDVYSTEINWMIIDQEMVYLT